MWSIKYLSALALALAGCSEGKPAEVETSNLSETMLVPEADTKPAHRYEFKEGLTYGYISAVSEEEAKKGKAAGDVSMYKYHGNSGGVHKVSSVDANGAEISRYECASPCVAIKAYYGSKLERIAYNPGSIIGSVFQDAMNGRLEPTRTPTPPTMIASGWAGEYDGMFEGEARGSVTIKDDSNGISAEIGIGHAGCSGGVKFNAPRPNGNVVRKRFPVDDGGLRCVLTLTRDGKRLTIEEDACSAYHGFECSFNGVASR